MRLAIYSLLFLLLSNPSIHSMDTSQLELAVRLSLQSQLLQKHDPAALEVSALLAVESLNRLNSVDTDQALRSALSLLRKPFGAVHRDSNINSIALSPDGNWLAVSSDDQTVRIVTISTGTTLATLSYAHRVRQINFTPDGKLMAVVSGNIVGLFDLRQKTELRPLQVGTEILSLAVSPNNHVLAVAGQDNFVKVFDPETRKEIVSFNRTRPIRDLAIAADGSLLATASGNIVEISGLQNRAEPITLKHAALVRMISFSPTEPLIASATATGMVRLSNTRTGTTLVEIKNGSAVNALTFSPDGHFLATGSIDGTTRIFRVSKECEELSELTHQGPVASIVFAGPHEIVTASADHTARVFDLRTAREIERFIESTPITSVAANPNSGIIVIASDKWVRFFQLTKGNNEIPLLGHQRVNHAAFSRNGRLAIGAQNRIYLFNTANGAAVPEAPRAQYPIPLLAYSADGHFLAFAEQNGPSQIIELFDGFKVTQIAQSDLDGKAVTGLAFSADASRLAIIGNSSQSAGEEQAYMQLFDPFHATRVGSIKTCSGLARSVALSPNHGMAILGTSEHACIFDYDRKEELAILDNEQISSLAFSPNAHVIAVGTQAGDLHIFNSEGKKIFSTREESAITFLLYADDNSTLCANTAIGIAHCFTTPAGVEFARITGLNIQLFAFRNRELLTFSMDEDGPLLQTHPLGPQDLINQACSILTRNLLPAEWRTYMGSAAYHKTCPNLP